MPWNGSGVFNRTIAVFTGATVWNDALVADRDVRADDHDTHDEDIATGLENTVTRDGQNAASANLPMGGFRHTGVANATARDQYAAVGQVQDQSFSHVPSSGVTGNPAIALTPTPAITSYVAGQRFSFVVEAANAGAITIDVSALGAKALQKLGAALVADDLTLGDLIEIEYDGTQFQLLTPVRTPVFKAGSIATAALADDAVTLAKMATGTAGNLHTFDASGDPAVVATGSADQVLTSNGAGLAPTMQGNALPPEHINGLTLSNGTDTAHDIDITTGKARDAADTGNLEFTAAVGKQLDVSWAAGGTPGTPTGGLSSSLTLSNNTLYFAIAGKVSDTEEIGIDTSVTGANLVTDHTFTNTRMIGAVRTDGSANIVNDEFTQVKLGRTEYTSAAQTVTAGGALTLLHGLNAEPWNMSARMVCISAVNNYSIGDQVSLAFGPQDGSVSAGIIVTDVTSTDITLRYGSTASNSLLTLDKTTGAVSNTPNTSWNIVIRADV